MLDHEQLTHLEHVRDRVLTSIDNIEKQGWRFYETRGDLAMIDVTAQHLQERKSDAQMLEHMAEAWKLVGD